MDTLTTPSAEEAARFTRGVGYLEAAVGIEMSPTAGHSPRKITSLPMVWAFLQPIEDISAEERKATVNFINPAGLAAWVSDTIGDAELGRALAGIAADGRAYGQQVHDLKRLLAERLSQCEALLREPAVNS